MSSTHLDGMNDQIRKTINETVTALEALGCSKQTALGLMVVQAAIRMEDQSEIRKLRDFLDSLARDYDAADMEEATDGTTH